MLKTIFQYIYSFYAIVVFLILFFISFLAVLVTLLFPEKTKDKYIFYILKYWSVLWHYATGIIPKVYNPKKIDNSINYIIVANHQSFIDACLLYISMQKNFKTLGKHELRKIPLFRLILKSVMIFVDRSNMRARVTSFREMVDVVDNGTSIAIFPEGTFADTKQEKMLPFQDGAFSLAIHSKHAILPVLFIDAAERMNPFSIFMFTPGIQRMILLPPIPTHTLHKDDAKTLTRYTQKLMQEAKDYALKNNCKDVWDFCTQYMQNNKIV